MFSITEDNSNKDIPIGMNKEQAYNYYMKMWGNFKSKVGEPVIESYKDKYILRADLTLGGLKSFGGERVIAESKHNTFIYCAPRQGHAPDAIANLAQIYNKKVVFFCPSSKEVSNHQASLFSYKNVDIRFIRIAAMPVLNSYAKKWAKENDAEYIPLGFKDMPIVTAGLINMGNRITKQIGKEPTEIWCAISTGTMTRALQIAWQSAKGYGVAVARNLKKGEIGNAKVVSATIPFLKACKTKHTLPFPTTVAYDAKAWDLFVENGKPGSIFINVGSDQHITRNLKLVDISNINSYRDWHDFGDIQKNRAYKIA